MSSSSSSSQPISDAMSESNGKVKMENELMKKSSKLVLWHTRDCKPLFTQHDLLPIMTNLGFVPIPVSAMKITNFDGITVAWMEYKYCGIGAFRSHPRLRVKKAPIPRLPYPYIDGLHLYTYRAFLEDVHFYLFNRFSDDDIFHLQGIPAYLDYPELELWQYTEASRTICRLGTLDPDLLDLYSDDTANFMPVETFPVKEENYLLDDDPEITMVQMDDIIVNYYQQY